MSDTVKVIIEMPKEVKADIDNGVIRRNIDKIYLALANGTPLDDVKAEIITERHNLADAKEWGRYYGLGIALEILDNIGKAESEVKSNE